MAFTLFRFLVLITPILLLTGCFTTPALKKDYNFTKSDKLGLLAISSPYLTHSSFVRFWKVNLDEAKFEGQYIRMSTCGDCIPGANTYSLGNIENPEFRVMRIPAGTYAIISIRGNRNNFRSYCRGSITFEIEAGKVNMVVAKRAMPDMTALHRLKVEISKFPEIDADVVAAKIPAAISFPRAGKNGKTCWYPDLQDETFRVMNWEKFVQNRTD